MSSDSKFKLFLFIAILAGALVVAGVYPPIALGVSAVVGVFLELLNEIRKIGASARLSQGERSLRRIEQSYRDSL